MSATFHGVGARRGHDMAALSSGGECPSRRGIRQCRHGNLTSQHSNLSPTLLLVDDGTLACDRCGAPVAPTQKFCGACGAPVARPAPAEVRKTVTAVFCDVTGSTVLARRLDPEALRAVMEQYFAAVSAVLARHGGTVEKFVGDAVMAVFGVPVAHEDDALRACRAAVEILAAVAEVDRRGRGGARRAVRGADRGGDRRGGGRRRRPRVHVRLGGGGQHGGPAGAGGPARGVPGRAGLLPAGTRPVVVEATTGVG